jgi:hypothetical protein
MKVSEFFENNKYVVLEGGLSKEVCNDLTKHMFKLFDEGKLEKDTQCPLSDSVYGDSKFDKLLNDLCVPIGNNIGKKLLPTYTYCRIYRHGEILTPHIDRPSCEISVTCTLGIDSDIVWPIYLDENKDIQINLEIGDFLVYKGCEVSHWRPKFKGKWQVQLFFHYVNANGYNTEHVFDKRGNLSTTSTKKAHNEEPKKKSIIESSYELFTNKQDNTQSNTQIDVSIANPFFDYTVIPSLPREYPTYIVFGHKQNEQVGFTKNECEKIISIAKNNYGNAAKVGSSGGTKNVNIRSANVYDVLNNQENRWIYYKLGIVLSLANQTYFNYDLWGIPPNLQLIEYNTENEQPGHYDKHVDVGLGEYAFRKISVVVQLSDPSDYDGCELRISALNNEVIAPKNQGTIHLFASYLPHEVTPIKSGVRYSLVAWILGPILK